MMKASSAIPGDRSKIVEQHVLYPGPPPALRKPYVVHDPASGYDTLELTFPLQQSAFHPTRQVEWAHEIRKYIQAN